jgi:hypothetical protein
MNNKRYKKYWKSGFQKNLSTFARTGVMNGWDEISTELENNDIPINEYVYRVKLKCNYASIIIYSSVDKITDETREKGCDAVRIIYEWKTKNGKIYCKIATRKRIKKLFENIKISVVEASKNYDRLNNYSWQDNIQSALS